MIFRDNKSRDCRINEVTAYKGREKGGAQRSHRGAPPPETGDRRISNSSYRRSSRRGTNCVTGILFSPDRARCPFRRYSSPDAIFPGRIISYSIANYRLFSDRRFLTRFDLSETLGARSRTNSRMMKSFVRSLCSTDRIRLTLVVLTS